MTYPTCKTCKYWRREEPDDEGWQSGWGECLKAEGGRTADGYISGLAEHTLAWAEGYCCDGKAYLNTSGLFGCVQHEPVDE